MGQAAQQLSPGRTTLLEAVNICLATIGEAPVNSLETQQVGEAAEAERALLEFHKEGQAQGWSWNRETEVPFHRDSDTGELTVPANIVQWAPSRVEWNGRFQLRGARVYDLQTRSYAITEATIYANVVTLLSWDESPEVYNRWATIRAARVFGNRAVGNTTTYQLTQADQDEAWANLLRIDTAQSQPNALTGGDSWATFRPRLGVGGRRGSGLGEAREGQAGPGRLGRRGRQAPLVPRERQDPRARRAQLGLKGQRARRGPRARRGLHRRFRAQLGLPGPLGLRGRLDPLGLRGRRGLHQRSLAQLGLLAQLGPLGLRGRRAQRAVAPTKQP
jgi:hypothetical protein